MVDHRKEQWKKTELYFMRKEEVNPARIVEWPVGRDGGQSAPTPYFGFEGARQARDRPPITRYKLHEQQSETGNITQLRFM
jgi:hypothetical protein